MQCIFFSVKLLPLSIILVRFLILHVVWFILIAVYHSVVWIYPNRFIHSAADRHLGYFQFRALMNNAAVNILRDDF